MEDVRVMAAKLDSIIVEGRKIFANVPRFQRGHGKYSNKVEGRKEIGRYGTKEKERKVEESGRYPKRNLRSGIVTNTSEQESRRNREVNRSYLQVVRNGNTGDNNIAPLGRGANMGRRINEFRWNEPKPNFAHLAYSVKKEDLVRFKKAYDGVVSEAGMTYNIQEHMNMD